MNLLYLNVVCAFSDDTKQAFTCVLNVATLSCPRNYQINLISAAYGQYATTCASQCCNPDSSDCTESLETTAPLDWEGLVESCQNKTFCQVEHSGRALGSCSEPYWSDYLAIGYNCIAGMKQQ